MWWKLAKTDKETPNLFDGWGGSSHDESQTSGRDPQVFIHTAPIDPNLFQPAENTYSTGRIKPEKGGLYTAPYLPSGPYQSEWEQHINTQYRNWRQNDRKNLAAHVYDVDPGANVLDVQTPEQLEALVKSAPVVFLSHIDKELYKRDRWMVSLDWEKLAKMGVDGVHFTQSVVEDGAHPDPIEINGRMCEFAGTAMFDTAQTIWLHPKTLKHRGSYALMETVHTPVKGLGPKASISYN